MHIRPRPWLVAGVCGVHTDDRDAGQRGRVRDEPHRADLDCECLGLMDAARGVGVFRLVSCVSTRCADAVTPRVSEDMDGPNSTAGAAAVNAPAWATVELATYKPDLRATITETLKRNERTGRRLTAHQKTPWSTAQCVHGAESVMESNTVLWRATMPRRYSQRMMCRLGAAVLRSACTPASVTMQARKFPSTA
jgi:hypothetical protein